MGVEGKKGSGPKVKLYRKHNNRIPESKIIDNLQKKYESIDESNITTFADIPLSSATQKGLLEAGFIEPTDIQKQSIGVALRGHDILGAAKTGSGKTLAFLIPVLEKLYCQQWSRENGLAAIIITPARELAVQIFETANTVGKYHGFSVASVIGGQNRHHEKHRIDQCNIIICTPGRLLDHMDKNPRFDCVSMQILVIDEADRCLDEKFKFQMNAIIENLPPERQTLLFSATQTKSVQDLARLSLKDPMYISAHEHATHSTPEGLQQSYVECNLEDKMTMLWSFIKNHLKHKIIVFFSSCKQVKFINDAFCKMRPGTVLLALHGNLHQSKRIAIYDSFRRKENAVLFATDIAARGLDFPNVNWVVQMDCPEDIDSYIHRAGRTARFRNGGESLLVLLPSEKDEMVARLIERKIPIQEIQIDTKYLTSPAKKLEALLARYSTIKESAQRAVVAYVKSVHLMKDKKIFNVKKLNIDDYARSMGLAVCPRIRFLSRMQKNEENQKKVAKQNTLNLEEKMIRSQRSSDQYSSESENGESADEEEESPLKKNENDDSAFALNDDSGDDSDGGDIFKVKRTNIDIQTESDESEQHDDEKSKNKKAITKAAIAKRLLRKKIVPNTKKTFDDEGKEVIDRTKVRIVDADEEDLVSGIDIEAAKKVLREEDKFDKQRYREKIREKHREERRKLKAERLQKALPEDEDEEEGGEEVEKGESEDDEESDHFSGWKMPDPDKIYGPKKYSDDEESDYDPEDKIHRPPKRKLVTQEHKNNKKRILIKENTDLRAAEELALQFLKQ